MDTKTIKASKRQAAGRAAANAARSEGLVPAVLYGQQQESLPISVPAKAMEKVLLEQGPDARLTLEVEGGPTCTVQVREIQRGIVSRKLEHLDFQVVGS